MWKDLVRGLKLSLWGFVTVLLLVISVVCMCGVPSMVGYEAVALFVISIIFAAVGLCLMWILGISK